MSEFFTLLLREAENGWVWMYTAGMPDEARENHVAELESDAWEHETLASERGERFGWQFLHRVLRGMPADVGWRVSHGRRGFEGRNWLEVMLAFLITLGVVVAIPVSGLFLPFAGAANAGRNFAVLPLIHAVLLISVLVLPGILTIERYPIAGGLLTLIGCLCLMALFWWQRETMGVIVIGTCAAAVATVRLHRLPPT